jgi:hypothetical protein
MEVAKKRMLRAISTKTDWLASSGMHKANGRKVSWTFCSHRAGTAKWPPWAAGNLQSRGVSCAIKRAVSRNGSICGWAAWLSALVEQRIAGGGMRHGSERRGTSPKPSHRPHLRPSNFAVKSGSSPQRACSAGEGALGDGKRSAAMSAFRRRPGCSRWAGAKVPFHLSKYRPARRCSPPSLLLRPLRNAQKKL